jgi:hypothetical protein
VQIVTFICVLPIKRELRTVSLSAGGVVKREERRGVGFLKGGEKQGRRGDAGECNGEAPECILLHQGPQSWGSGSNGTENSVRDGAIPQFELGTTGVACKNESFCNDEKTTDRYE